MDLLRTQSVRDLLPAEPTRGEPAWKILVAVLWRRKRAVAFCILASLVAGIAVLIYSPSLLDTSSTVRVGVADLSQPGMDTGTGSLLAHQPEVMRSTPVIALAITSPEVRALPLLQGKKNPIEFIQSSLAIRASGEPGIFELTLTSSKPADAEKLLGAVVAAYTKFEASPKPVSAAQVAALRDQRQKTDDELATIRQQIDGVLKQQKELCPTPESRQSLVEERAQLAAALGTPGPKPAAQSAMQERLNLLTLQAEEYDALDDQAARLQAEVERLTALSDRLGQRLTRADHPPEDQVTIAMLKAPQTRFPRVWPKPWPILETSLLCGVLLGCMVALALGKTSARLQGAEDAKSVVKVPVLGSVPAMPDQLSSAVLRGQCVLMAPTHSAAQACLDVGTKLQGLLVSGIDKMILVTGPGNGQGKSAVASNLAIAMAESGQRVVLVDGHPNLPMVNRIFGIEDGVGLNSAIEGKLRAHDVLHVTPLHGLEILPAGSSDANWPELLNRPQFLALLTELSERFDRVIIDGGPALTDECRIISAFCDATVLVVDQRRCRRRDLRSAAEGLRAVGAKLTGIVLNEIPSQHITVAKRIPRESKRRLRATVAASPQLADSV